ncbi:hypothetical protein ACFQ5M_00310 [Agrilactobacillus yilanensis]|uniref:IpaB/EvcA family protein n=1 Tax=Agrilactobacillus yilanensis TaxID=2485997 RepID=A0ABW4J2Y1_9LACO|nr:hypothetical protein [Agrilactobacillus yilanensis]
MHDQSQQIPHKDGTLEIKVTDTTNVNYTLSHELWHMLLKFQGYSQLQFPLTTGTPQLDEQIGATATALYNAAAHVLILAAQKEAGLIDERVESAFMAGVYNSVPAEDPNDKQDQLLIFRVLSLLDTFVFWQGNLNDLSNDLLLKYPESFPYAKQLYQTLTAKKIDGPFAFRRSVVALFKAFANILETLGYVPLNHAEFAVLTPVFSQRQLRLTLNQTLEVLHSEYTNLKTHQRAYVAVGKTDRQAAFVFENLAPETSPAQFQQLYEQPLEKVLKANQITYGIR